jgi:hypothetical protein
MLRAKGSIDEYMQQLMDAKSEAIDVGVRPYKVAELPGFHVKDAERRRI